MPRALNILPNQNIQNKIFTFRGVQVMIDSDLAELYGITTSRLNEQVKRNIERFPEDFMFQLSLAEWENLISQNAISSWGGKRKLPYVFTEQGIASLSGVIKNEIAAKVNISIMRAFVQMRKILYNNIAILQRLENLERKQIIADLKIEDILNAMEDKSVEQSQKIFFDGQFFDSYIFIAEVIKSAKKSIILIDNYIDESVLTMLDKREKNVTATVFTRTITKQLNLDLQKHNKQYQEIKIKTYSKSHDRFIIIDDSNIYHIGASLKDLGNKWFACSKIEFDAKFMIQKLNDDE
ncbi:MAG: ORF6N domain-containing protein [Bacteroidales bacterium]|nr:ORF6N domain-containing protein [Bacteroidales bacterium]MDD3860805.1 ORF6N domain-containing protein [Bacteroidales bacterium]